MTEIYFIPGLGADARLFSKQKQAGFNFKVLEWITPNKNERLATYALRLSEGIINKEDFMLVGVSLGGIMAQEIARIYKPKKIILISSVQSSKEIPFYFRGFRYLPIHRLIPGKFFRVVGKVIRHILGGTTHEEGKQIEAMINASDPDFMYWAIDQVIHWRCKQPLKGMIHLHGTMDTMFPGIFLQNATFIKGGSHLMVYTKAKEVNAYLKNFLTLPVE